MMRTRSLLIAVAAAVLIGILAVAALRNIAPPVDPPQITDTDAADVTPADVAVSPPPAANAVDAGEPPPWASADGVSTATAEAADSAAEVKRAQQLAQLQQSVMVLADDALERSIASNEHVRRTLDMLEAMDDPAVNAQIDLAAVRHNFEIGVRVQTLVQELQAQMAESSTPERQQRIDVLKRELETLQLQLRSDITPAGASLPVPPLAGQ